MTATTNDIIMRCRDGKPVKYVICLGNHYPNKFLNKGQQTDSATNKSQTRIANTVTTNPSTTSDLSSLKVSSVVTKDILKGTIIITVNAKQFLTISGNNGSHYDSTWDQTLDYTGLIFCQTHMPVAQLIHHPLQNNFFINIQRK